MSLRCALLIASFIISTIHSSNAAKILIFGLPSKSHMKEVDGVGEELLKKGHEVFFAVGNGTKSRVSDKPYKFIEYTLNFDVFEGDEQFTKQFLSMLMTTDPHQVMMKMMKIDVFALACENTIGNRAFLDELKSKKADLVIIDSLPFTKCLAVIAEYVKAPLIILGSGYHILNSRMHMTTLPAQLDSLPWKMTFLQRVRNTFYHMMFENMHYYMQDYSKLRKMSGFDFTDVEVTNSAAKLHLLNLDPVFQPPFLVPPHARLVGGLGFRPPKPLDKEYQKFADEAKGGFVVFTLGSMFKYHPKEFATILAKAFELVPQYKFVMRVEGEEAKLYGKNVKTVKWIPQNDILAHPNCKAFITHCGNNGQIESLWNGVPMVGIPLMAEQAHNGMRIQERKFGILVKIKGLTAESLAEAIVKVSDDNSIYRKNIKKASKIFKNRSNPRKRAADAVEEVLSGEADFYYPQSSFDLNILQYYLFDVFIFLFFVAIMLMTTPIVLIYCCCKHCRKGKAAKEKSS